MAAPKLSDDVKAEIVRRLACFQPGAQIVKDIKAELGIDVTRQTVSGYDPTKMGFEAGDRWAAQFHEHRKAFLSSVANVPVADQAYRLQLLHEGIEVAREQRNFVLVAKLLEQVAKELGGAYTNARQVNHGGSVGRFDITADEARAEIRARAAAARERAIAASGLPTTH